MKSQVRKNNAASAGAWQPSASGDPEKGGAEVERNLEPLADGERLFRVLGDQVAVEPPTLNKRNFGHPNRIRTTKFTPVTWLPLSLFYQFQRTANIYFLVVALVVIGLGSNSPKNWKSKVFPFLGVILWTALKDAYEDMNRHRDDQEENRGKTKRYDLAQGAFVEVEWQNVLAGDLLFIAADEAFPADLMLLQANGGKEAFVSTVNLDGETNLKEKRAMPILGKLADTQEQLSRSGTAANLAQHEAAAARFTKKMVGEPSFLQLAKPEPSLSEVRAKLTMGAEECSGGETNFLPRGCVLRNTAWIVGIVAYAGDETKTKLNVLKGRNKFSNMQRYLNYCIQGLLVFLVVVTLICATLGTLLKSDEDSWPTKFFKYIVTFYHVVPVSLYVVFEMMKLLLGWQVNTDQQMFDAESGKGAVARTADLMEELGQVSFVFSDKTGTLTANEMVFARCCIQGKDPGDFRKSQGAEAVAAARSALTTPGSAMHDPMKLFFTSLAVCHSVQVEDGGPKSPEGQSGGGGQAVEPHFSGMSPDEVALVQAAHDVGVSFRKRSRDPVAATTELTIAGPSAGEERRFQVLHELQFNSDRKRMSVVVKQDERILCFTKGADSVMEKLVTSPLDSGTKEALSRFSKQGLRTLVIAMKQVKPAFYQEWQARLKEAEGIVDSTRNAKVEEVQAQMETELTLVGLTAVEDRLQDGVPQAIQTVKDAGVRVWVLTGDKTETAVDIAKSCALFGPSTQLTYAVDADSTESSIALLEAAKKALSSLEAGVDGGLVLDGTTIKFALESAEATSLIYELGIASRSCVCCRLSPMQKRLLVELVRHKSPTTITLAIGDGANDVPMIEGAHVGIGIRGKEGAQAVQVSDIAISQFRFLVPLLLCHGRRAYRRVACFLCYYLYKNVTLVVSDIVWSIQDSFRAQIAYPEYLSMGFNVLFTSWHILFVLGFDRGCSDEVANRHPELYVEGPQRRLFNPRVFGTWMLYAVWHGAVVWLIPNLTFGSRVYTTYPSDFWVSACTSFLITVQVVNCKLLLNCFRPHAVTALLPTLASWGLTVVSLFLLGEVSLGYEMSGNEKMRGIPVQMFSNMKVYACLVGVTVLALLPDIAEKLARRFFFPSPMDKLYVLSVSEEGEKST